MCACLTKEGFGFRGLVSVFHEISEGCELSLCAELRRECESRTDSSVKTSCCGCDWQQTPLVRVTDCQSAIQSINRSVSQETGLVLLCKKHHNMEWRLNTFAALVCSVCWPLYSFPVVLIFFFSAVRQVGKTIIIYIYIYICLWFFNQKEG